MGSRGNRPAAGGGRWVDVQPQRLEPWLRGFADRHGPAEGEWGGDVVRFRAADGALAECHPPFPPLHRPPQQRSAAALAATVAAHALRARMVGVLLVRLGGYAAGVFDGDELIASKVGSRLVHSRHSAGGQSQQRFRRRRDEQIKGATGAAADVAARVLLPYADILDAVVLGGDRRAVDATGSDRRLEPVFDLATPRFLTVPDPKLAVLRATLGQFRAIRVRLVEP